ncbi:hypothetical protein [Embleya sp. NPDC005971]|uniref:hypothetical protein n=1 Tax=Embleya sp. NPDC005971 TaxID=3156724 RepID=UPI0033EBBFEF
MSVQWLACDLRTGMVIEELRALTPSGALSRRLGAHTSLSAALPIAGAPVGWQECTLPGRTMLVAVSTTPVWAGIVLSRRRGSAPACDLGLATPEAYLDRRYARDHTWTQVNEASVIAAGLLGDVAIDGIGLTVDAPATGALRDRTYADSEDRTVLSALVDLMGVQDGPEWEIAPRWRDGSQTSIELVARVRPRIGVQPAVPAAVFDLPGCVITYEQSESYEQGKGATVTRAAGDGEGSSRTVSDDMIAADLLAAGWPRYDYRWTPSTSISQQVTVDDHARAALALMATGSSVWTVQARASAGPQLGQAWDLGHTIRLQVQAGHSDGHPDGVDVVARAWGWDWDPAADVVTPILVEEG